MEPDKKLRTNNENIPTLFTEAYYVQDKYLQIFLKGYKYPVNSCHIYSYCKV